MNIRFTAIIISQFAFLISCKQSNEYLLHEAGRLYEKKKYKEVIEICNDVIKEKNNLQLSYFYRGLAYAGLKQYKKAIHSLDIVMNLQKRGDLIFVWNKNSIAADEVARTQVPYHEALYQRALVKYQMDSLHSSMLDIQVCIENNYEYKSNCFLWQGQIYIRMGDINKGCGRIQRAIKSAATQSDSTAAENLFNEFCKMK